MSCCPKCTPRQKCPLHHEEYEPEIHGANGLLSERAERIREIERFRDMEMEADEQRLIREFIKK